MIIKKTQKIKGFPDLFISRDTLIFIQGCLDSRKLEVGSERPEAGRKRKQKKPALVDRAGF